MSTALEHLANRAEAEAVTFAADADRFSAQGKGIIAHHYRRVAKAQARDRTGIARADRFTFRPGHKQRARIGRC